MTFHEILGAAAIITGLYGYVPYVRGMMKVEVHPHMFSWFIWGLITWIAFAAQVSDGAGAGSWIMCVTGVFCLGIAAVAFKSGERDITRSDWGFFGLSLAAIPLWVMTNNPLWSVILISLIDVLAMMPTVRKSWSRPWSESIEAYAVAGLKFMLSIFALENISLVTALYPAVVVGVNALFCAMLVVRRRGIARPA